MKQLVIAGAALLLVSTSVQAADTLNAEAVKRLIAGNTAHGLTPSGATPKIYFAADGKLVRQDGSTVREGTWHVKDDGTQCVEGTPGGCAMIVRNDDGTHDRVNADGKKLLRWTSVTPGKGF